MFAISLSMMIVHMVKGNSLAFSIGWIGSMITAALSALTYQGTK